ncbi:hypothetical protein BHE74_00043408, partial [Ensete ventricosum]
MRTARYRAVPQIGTVFTSLPPKIGQYSTVVDRYRRYRSILTVVGCCRAVAVHFDHRRLLLGDRPLPGGTAKIDHWRSISAVGSRFRPSAVEAAGFDRRRSIEGEINRRWSIEGEKGKNKKRRRRKKKMIHTSFPRAILDRTPSPSSPIGDSSPSREDGMFPHARRKIEA